ncbi:Uncharacterized conserved protein, DUF427 family [Modicisalibacter ilicicola DSM 19980]|uniref:Uncharacterized conserved protein, DUF427 family n=1 Tax=Modicisalibacter ilicicola DSM 19980 TaxID=1121942 RepID=A0A1M5BFM1_9GAMM|nr:DUF427 domain-containing protein [Halomonas ilicicola]SHF41383.1 Uncharacterized conserved protein, DUF427 family [Halomonas ilicicola DSM 19980]
MIHDPAGRISLHPHHRRVRIWAGGQVIADSHNAIELRETDYPPRQYLPREDVDLQRLTRSSTVTHCPFKGDTTYFSLERDDATLKDIAWSYERPFEAMTAIKGHLAFDTRLVEEELDWASHEA